MRLLRFARNDEFSHLSLRGAVATKQSRLYLHSSLFNLKSQILNLQFLLLPVFFLELPVKFDRSSKSFLQVGLRLPTHQTLDFRDICIIISWFDLFSFLCEFRKSNLSAPRNLHNLLGQFNETNGNS